LRRFQHNQTKVQAGRQLAVTDTHTHTEALQACLEARRAELGGSEQLLLQQQDWTEAWLPMVQKLCGLVLVDAKHMALRQNLHVPAITSVTCTTQDWRPMHWSLHKQGASVFSCCLVSREAEQANKVLSRLISADK